MSLEADDLMQLTLTMLDDSFCFEESGSDYWSGSIIGKNASAKYTTLAFQKCKTSKCQGCETFWLFEMKK